jgi:hypothetical protein
MKMAAKQVRLGWILLALFATLSAAPLPGTRLEILSPQNGARITQNQNVVLVSGRVANHRQPSVTVDIVLLLDVSLSTAHYSGVDLSGLGDLPALYISPEPGSLRPQVSVARPTRNSVSAPAYNLRNSIFAAEVAASLRLLTQLDAQTTRVALITFSDDARVRQAWTHDFARVRDSLDEIYRDGPYGSTNMVDGIRLGIKELLGFGASEQRPDAIKTQLLLTDGLPSLPIGAGKAARRRICS